MPSFLSYGAKTNKELITYHWNSLFGLTELPFVINSDTNDGTGGTGNGLMATLIDCTSLNGVTARSKQLRIQAVDTAETPASLVINLWFAENIQELQAAIETVAPAQILAFGYGTDVTIPLSTSYFAIDYDSGLSGVTIDPATFMMSLIIS
jgi:hypothetical protein